MSFNLIDLVKDQLSEQVIGSLGSVIGGNSSQNDLALNSAIPGLLSSLTSFGGSQSNADLMFKGIEAQDDSILDNLGDLLGGSGQSGLLEAGTKMLGSLLGGGIGSLVSSIAGFSGAGKSGTGKLLGLLAPIIFGVIKRKLMGGGGFDVGSLMGLLNGQKSNVAAAMPNGFNLISSSVEKGAENISERVVETTQVATKEGKSFLGKLLPLALLAGAGILAYNYFMNNKSVEPARDTGVSSQINPAPVNAVQVKNFDNVDLGKNITSAMGSMTTSFGSITDVASAKAALPNIAEATGQLSGLAGLFSKLPEVARGPITSLIGDNLSKVQAVVNKIGVIPGVGDIIKPSIEKLSTTMALFK